MMPAVARANPAEAPPAAHPSGALPICRTRTLCGPCRAQAAFRHAVAHRYGLADDFACPVVVRGLGDVVAAVATPVARALRLPCVDPQTQQLRPESPCARRKERLNAAVPFVAAGPPAVPRPKHSPGDDA